jgi:hypothetical protein
VRWHRQHRSRSAHQHLAELGGIGEHRQRLGTQPGEQRHAAGQQSAQQIQTFVNQRLQRLQMHCVRLAPCKRQDALPEAARALRSRLNLDQVLRGRMRRIQVFERQRDVAQHRRHDVVEIVRDAAGQRAHGFEFLRLVQL